MNSKIILSVLTFTLSLTCLTACHEKLEDKAEREAQDFTRRYCPTPFVNCVRTDSVTFDKASRSYTYHCTFSEILDSAEIIDNNKQKIKGMLSSSIRESTSMKIYIEAGYHFHYVCRSKKNPQRILIKVDL